MDVAVEIVDVALLAPNCLAIETFPLAAFGLVVLVNSTGFRDLAAGQKRPGHPLLRYEDGVSILFHLLL